MERADSFALFIPNGSDVIARTAGRKSELVDLTSLVRI
jgi:hypothetical protein